MDVINDYLGVSRDTVLLWIANRNMPVNKVGRFWRFKVSEVDEWIRSGGAAEKAEDVELWVKQPIPGAIRS